MANPSPFCLVNGTSSVNGVNVGAGTTVTVALLSAAGVGPWVLTCIGTDESTTPAAINATLVINQTTKTATFTAPALGSAVILQSTVGASNASAGYDVNGKLDPTFVSTFGVFVLTSDGNRVMAANETTEGSLANGWTSKLNPLIRNRPADVSFPVSGVASFDSNTLISSHPASRQWQPWAPLGNTPCTVHPHYDYERTGTYRDAVAVNVGLNAAGGGQYLCTWFTAVDTRPTFTFWTKNLGGGTRMDAYIWDPAVTVKATMQCTTSSSQWLQFSLQVAGGTPLTVGNNYFCVFDLRPSGTQTSQLIDPTIQMIPSAGTGIFASNFVRLAVRGEMLIGNLDNGDIYKGNPWWWELNTPLSELHVDTNSPTIATEWFAASANVKPGYMLGNRRYAADAGSNIPSNGSLIDQQTIGNALSVGNIQRVIAKAPPGAYSGGFNYTGYLRALYLPAGYAARVVRPGR